MLNLAQQARDGLASIRIMPALACAAPRKKKKATRTPASEAPGPRPMVPGSAAPRGQPPSLSDKARARSRARLVAAGKTVATAMHMHRRVREVKAAAAQTLKSDKRVRRASRAVQRTRRQDDAASMSSLAKARAELTRAVDSASQAWDGVLKSVTAASLRATPGIAMELLDIKLCSLGPSLRVALGKGLLEQAQRAEGVPLKGGLSVRVVVDEQPIDAAAAAAAAAAEASLSSWSARGLWRSSAPSREATDDEKAQELVQVLSLRVYPAGRAPSAQAFGEVLSESDSSDSDSDSDDNSDDDRGGRRSERRGGNKNSSSSSNNNGGGGGGGGSDSDSDDLDFSSLSVGVADEKSEGRRRRRRAAAALDGSDDEGQPVSAGWEAERHELLTLDLDVDVALRINWKRFEVFCELHGPPGCCLGGCRPLGRLGVLACALRMPVRVWWHVGRNQARLALLDTARGLHFRSFAEMAPCGCTPRPDLLGVTSHVVRAVLCQITPEQPLHIDLAEGKGAEVRWGPHTVPLGDAKARHASKQ